MHGCHVGASFFAPWSRRVEPYIRIATGDYPQLKAKLGRDEALASFLHSLAHELVHYRQWLETNVLTERAVSVRASRIVAKYAKIVERP